MYYDYYHRATRMSPAELKAWLQARGPPSCFARLSLGSI
jgi:hypothetical protein